MGRTIHYEIHGTTIPWEVWRVIRAAQAILNWRLTWTSEELSLEPLGSGRRAEWSKSHSVPLEDAPVAAGFSKVCGDEWNALIVTKFATWVSRRLPEATVRLHDEGDYVLASYVEIRNGVLSVNLDAIETWRVHLRKYELTSTLDHVESAISLATRGVYFAPVPAKEYGDRVEIRSLGLTDKELGELYLDEVFERVSRSGWGKHKLW